MNLTKSGARVLLSLAMASLHPAGIYAQHTPVNPASSPNKVRHEKSHDMDTIHRMFNHTAKIKRIVTQTSNGVETTTESHDPKVAAMIQEHVLAMRTRMKKHQPIRAWDELFATLFQHADKVKFDITKTKRGVKIVETSSDPYTVKIIHTHAHAVSDFIKEGMMGMAKAHPAPAKTQQIVKARPLAFAGKGDGVRTCPVTGEPVDKNIKAEINGRTIYLCCASCKAIIQKSPSRYLKP